MSSFYTPEVRNYIVNSFNEFKGLTYDINEDELGQLWVIFFRDNWITLPPEYHLRIAERLKETITKLRNDGVPIGFGAIRSASDNE